MAQYAARPGGFASQRLGLLPAEMWDQGFQYLDSSSLARVRLVNKQFKALATRHFFRQAVLCYRPTWKLVRFMASVRSDKDNGSAVRDLALYIPIESHFVECHSYDFRRSLQAMPNLVKLSLTLSHPYNSTEKTSSQLLLADLLSSVYFPQMEELEIRGFLSHVLEGFVSRVASTLKKLRLDVEAPPGFTSTTTGPPFVVLREAAVPPASLGLLTRSGLPALNTFELFFDDMLSTENSLSVLAPNVGGNLERLQVHVVGLGECIFATISPHFTQLKVLVISCIPDLFAHPHESRRWGELIERSNVVYHCSLLTKLELLDWSMGYFGDWDRGWEYLLQITQHNPKLDQISFPGMSKGAYAKDQSANSHLRNRDLAANSRRLLDSFMFESKRPTKARLSLASGQYRST
ncbi:hypothetical protein VNI00_000721 [Paramarasmius palmivorus]|uniref:F-box domain-containing protein n=1 Tax=Paramarasmius palmivorus TaxID=297713 RepID=A0AAW0EBC2_9AGAR